MHDHEVEDLLVGLILDKKIEGRIDQVNQRVEISSHTTDNVYYNALEKWTDNVDSVFKTVLTRMS